MLTFRNVTGNGSTTVKIYKGSKMRHYNASHKISKATLLTYTTYDMFSVLCKEILEVFQICVLNMHKI